MNKMLIILCVFTLLFCLSCTKKQPEVTLLTENYPPLTYLDGDIVTGYAAEIVDAMQKVMKTDYKPTVLTWDNAYQRALSEPNIVIFTMERTDDREDKFNWIGPLGVNKTYFFARANSELDISNLDDAKEVPAIGTVTNWFSEQYLIDNGFNNLESSPNPSTVIEMLMNKKVDMIAFTDLSCKMIAEKARYKYSDLKPLFEFMSTGYYIGISKQTDARIVNKWQKAFLAIQREGELDKLKDRWFPEE